MNRRSLVSFLGALLVMASLLLCSGAKAQAESPDGSTTSEHKGLPEEAKVETQKVSEETEKGVSGPVAKTHYYWDEGLQIVSRRENLRLKVGGKLIVDGGTIEANDELERAFPDLEGSNAEFRQLTVSFSGVIRPISAVRDAAEAARNGAAPPVADPVMSAAQYDALEFKFEIDFANVRDILDNWIRFPRIPFVRHIRFGHIKEPFSLERLASITNLTFMEIALPTRAFAAGRNLGAKYDNSLFNDRMTVGAGAFLNTGSFSDLGQAQDEISEANGYNLTGRVTGLPWHIEEDDRLLHLGLSYSHQVREDEVNGFRTRPESRLTDDRLVDTGSLFPDNIDLINPELAVVSGPLSFQGEYVHAFTDGVGNPQFWGYYAYGSLFLTGEHRNYDVSSGVFSRLAPKNNFRPFQGGWGALELGLRYSFIDLNDEAIRGGRERNFTAGLNWYLNRNIRFMVNYIWANVEDRADPRVDDGRADIVQGRFQIVF
jgi:phosphate-selective porin OprO/OprP